MNKKKTPKKDFYGLLGVAKNSVLQEIKSAYKKLALKFHPDKQKPEDRDEQLKSLRRSLNHTLC